MKLPIRFWISALMLTSLLIIVTVVFTTEYYVNREQLEEDALAMNLSNASKLSALTNETFIGMQNTLLAHHEQVIENWNSKEQLDDILLDVFDSNANFNSVTIITAEGVGKANYPELNLVGKRVDTAGVNRGLELKQNFISEPYIGTNEKLMLIVSTAIYKDDEYVGMLNGLVWLQESNFLTRLLDENFKNSTTFATVYDSRGVYIYHPQTDWIGTRAKTNQATLDIEKGLSGVALITDRTGTEYYAGYAKVPISQWGIVSMTSKEEVLAPSRESFLRAFWVALPFVALALLATFIMIWFITKPLNRLAQLDPHKPLSELLHDVTQVKSTYTEVDHVKSMMHSFGRSQQRLVEELETLAVTDPLTGLSNRRRFQQLTELMKADAEPFGYLILDIDHFKSVNDTYGHLMGDQVLTTLAQLLKNVVPSSAMAFRLGGEEFAVLVQNTTSDGTFALAETIRHAIERHEFTIPQQVTVSLGAGYLDCQTCDLNMFFHDVDQQLYKAKERGRNRTETVFIENEKKHLS